MRHSVVLSALTVLALGGTAACTEGGGTSGADASSASAARGAIKIWLSNNKEELAWGKGMVDAWNAAHPTEQVTSEEIPAGKSSEEVIGAAITAGNAPCLVFNTSPAAVPQFHTVDSSLADQPSVALELSGMGGDHLEHQGQAAFGEDRLDAGDEGRKERVDAQRLWVAGHDETDGEGTRDGQRAGRAARHPAKLVGALQDSGLGVLADPRPTVQREGDGSLRDSGRLGDVADGGHTLT